MISADGLASGFAGDGRIKEKGGSVRFRPLIYLSRSVLIPQRKLDIARSVLGCRSGDCAEIGGGDVVTRETELHVIKGIEEVGADYQTVTLPGQTKDLHDAKVDILDAVCEKRISSHQAATGIRGR